MALSPLASAMLAHEARSLLVRLARVKPFALLEPMLPAAALLPSAQIAIERHLVLGRRELRHMVRSYLKWLAGAGKAGDAAEAQRRFTFLRMKFNVTLTQFDLFSDVITQRSEHDTGIWLSGLDLVSADALKLNGDYYRLPPVVCYLDRGPGAAIRRARTRLPGGGQNPVAVIRVPRERMVGSGIASSLVHEVGHQGAALLDLVNSLQLALRALPHGADKHSIWRLWERWISEIVADFWSIAQVGITSTLGLIGVVSLPRAFVFRLSLDDPHPIPWIRVKLSCTIGDALYPHPQWRQLADLWEQYYPRKRPQADLSADTLAILADLEATMPAFVRFLAGHKPPALRGAALGDAFDLQGRQPHRLLALYRTWCRAPAQMYRAPPSLAFAVLGQARAGNLLSPEDESQLLSKLLTHWALSGTLNTSSSSNSQLPARLLGTAWLTQERI
ncbi:MAG TPA: hypothetical protein VIT92_08560 [Burkholderiaceae bacterium]